MSTQKPNSKKGKGRNQVKGGLGGVGGCFLKDLSALGLCTVITCSLD